MEGSTLKITVVEARDLKQRKATGRSNPFVSVTMGDQKRSTKYIMSTLTPVWNEEIALYVLKLRIPFFSDVTTGIEPVKVVVMDKDLTGKKRKK